MQDTPRNELSMFGFISAGWRRGIVTFLFATQTMAIIGLYIDKNKADERNKEYIERLNERLLDRVLPAVEKMADKVDTVASQAGAAASKVDSVSNVLIQNRIRK